MTEIEVSDKSVFSAHQGKGKGKDIYSKNVFEQRRIETTTAVAVAQGASFTHKYDVDMFSQGFLINWPESYIKLNVAFTQTANTALAMTASQYVIHQAGLVATLSEVNIIINNKKFYIKSPAVYKMIRRMYETAQASEKRKYFNGEYRLNHSMNTATAFNITLTEAAPNTLDVYTAPVVIDAYQTFSNNLTSAVTAQSFYIPFSDLSPVFEGDDAGNHFFPLRSLIVSGNRTTDSGTILLPIVGAPTASHLSTYDMSFELTFYKPKPSEFEAMSKKSRDIVYRFSRFRDWSSSPVTVATTATTVGNESGLPVPSPIRMHLLQSYNKVTNMTTVVKPSVPDVGGSTFTISCDGIKRPYTYQDYFASASKLKVYQEYLKNYYGSSSSADSEAMPVINLNQFSEMGIYTIQLRDRLPFTGEDWETFDRTVRFNLTQVADATYAHKWNIVFETQAQMSFKWDGLTIPTDDYNLV